MKILLFLTIFLVLNCSKEETPKNFKQEKFTKKDSSQINNKDKSFDILKYLLDEEIGNEKPEKIDYKNYSVSFDNDGDSYSVYFNKIASEDINKDGIEDYIVERNSEGILGGNANTNSEIIYIIMEKVDEVKDQHKILTYAPFSYNTVDNVTYKNGVLSAVASQNYRAYSKPMDEVESTDLSFIYQDGNVYEKSYLSECELAKWKDKKILKKPSESFRTIDMHNYTEVLNEKFVTNDFECTIELSGCGNLNIVIEGDFKTTDSSQKSIDQKRNQFLDFLVKNTNISSNLKIVQNKYLQDNSLKEYTTIGDLSFNIFTNKHEDKLNFRLVLNKDINKNQTENWEITTRKK